ncbi:MAG: four helix bundle protein [Bacteroidales bacterium]|nr:four helix bundle protein [Bacteroidales bacterium]
MNEQENNAPFFRFEDLRIYAKAMDYISWLYRVLDVEFSNGNQKVLVKAFLKSAHSIALNTAEGSSRNKAQFLYYLKMAKSAVRECVVYTEIAKNGNLLNEADYDYSRDKLIELTKMIGSLIASLQRIANVSESDPMDMGQAPAFPDDMD